MCVVWSCEVAFFFSSLAFYVLIAINERNRMEWIAVHTSEHVHWDWALSIHCIDWHCKLNRSFSELMLLLLLWCSVLMVWQTNETDHFDHLHIKYTNKFRNNINGNRFLRDSNLTSSSFLKIYDMRDDARRSKQFTYSCTIHYIVRSADALRVFFLLHFLLLLLFAASAALIHSEIMSNQLILV